MTQEGRTRLAEGLDTVLTPGREILVATQARQMVEYLVDMDEAERRAIGERARARVLRDHTAAHRALELERYVEVTSRVETPA